MCDSLNEWSSNNGITQVSWELLTRSGIVLEIMSQRSSWCCLHLDQLFELAIRVSGSRLRTRSVLGRWQLCDELKPWKRKWDYFDVNSSSTSVEVYQLNPSLIKLKPIVICAGCVLNLTFRDQVNFGSDGCFIFLITCMVCLTQLMWWVRKPWFGLLIVWFRS